MTSALQEQLQFALGDTYQLQRELGGGGMSRVFVAQEKALGRQVVVKVLLPELAAAVNIERFRREILLAAQLQHPHIVPLLSAGEAKDLPYFIMPFVTGESLRARITREGEFPIADTVRILRDVVSALAYAHAHGVVHRDVKPDNVLLSHGVAVVTDFGVAKALSASSGSGASGLTSVGVALGTPAYMAPEQATASPHTDHRADIYALGVMAYEMLTGLPPFSGRTAQAVLSAHVIEDPEPVERRRPAVPPMLANLVRECLCKRPADRPQSALQVMNVLDAIATPSGGTAATTAVRLPAASPAVGDGRRRRLMGAAAGLLLVAIVAALVLRREPPAPAAQPAAPVPAALPADSATTGAAAQAGPPPEAPERPALPETRKSRTVRPERAAVPRTAVVPPARESAPAPVPTPALADSVPAEPSDIPPDTAPVAAPPPPADTAARPLPQPPLNVPPPPPKPAAAPADQRPAIRNLVAEYATAVEARSLDALRRLYPAMTGIQQRGWEQFFQLVRDVSANLEVSQLQVAGSNAQGRITGTYDYLNTSTGRPEHQAVSFQALFRLEGGKWKLVEVK